MAVNPVASELNNVIVSEADNIAMNTARNFRYLAGFTRKSQDAMTKAALSAVATENTKTAQNSMVSAAKGIQY